MLVRVELRAGQDQDGAPVCDKKECQRGSGQEEREILLSAAKGDVCEEMSLVRLAGKKEICSALLLWLSWWEQKQGNRCN